MAIIISTIFLAKRPYYANLSKMLLRYFISLQNEVQQTSECTTCYLLTTLA